MSFKLRKTSAPTTSTSVGTVEGDEPSSGSISEFNCEILTDYRMQWALNCSLLINQKYCIQINPYKMASKSDLFKNLFRLNRGNNVNIEFFTDNFTDLEFVIKYCHLNDVLVDSDNLECLLRISHEYRIRDLVGICENFIESNLTNDTCWVFYNLINNYTSLETDDNSSIDRIRVKLDDFIMYQFVEASSSENFGFINLTDLMLMLSDDRLNVRNEYGLIDIIGLWIAFNSTKRNVFVGQLMNCVRLGLLTLDQIETLWKNQVIKRTQSNDCLTNIRQARRNLIRTKRNLRPLEKCGSVPCNDAISTISCLFETSNSGSSSNNNNNNTNRGLPNLDVRPRLPHEAIFVFGGWENGGASKTVRIYNNRSKQWVVYKNNSESPIVLPRPLMSFGISLYKNTQLYIFGGEVCTQQATQEVLCYDLVKREWMQRAPMHEIRRDLVAVNLNEEAIFVIGGDNNKTVLDSVEKLLPGRNQWIEVAPMLLMRSAPAAEALDGQIYVLGGYTETQMEALTASCEMYNPKVDQWTFIKPMSQQRYYFNALVYGGFLYVVGGGDENQWSTVERYSPQTNIWSPMPSLLQQRADFAASILEEEFFCLGGGGDSFCTAEVEYWRPEVTRIPNNEEININASDQREVDNIVTQALPPVTPSSSWQRGPSLPTPTWGHRCVTVRGINIIMPYLKAQSQPGKSGKSKKNNLKLNSIRRDIEMMEDTSSNNAGNDLITDIYMTADDVTDNQIEPMIDE